jgi:hypothetical protein
MVEPGIRTRLTNLLAMVAAPEKYDKNVKLKFPFEFYLKKTLEFVKNIKVTAPAIVDALDDADPNDITLIQNLLYTQQGQIDVNIDTALLNAIGTYVNQCANIIINGPDDTVIQTLNSLEYRDNINKLHSTCINSLRHNTIPCITSAGDVFSLIPIPNCYNDVLCASLDVFVVFPNVNAHALHYSLFITATSITFVATKLAVSSD